MSTVILTMVIFISGHTVCALVQYYLKVGLDQLKTDTKSREIKQNIKNAVQAVFQGEGGGEKGNIKCPNPKRTIEITALNSFVDNNPSFKNFS